MRSHQRIGILAILCMLSIARGLQAQVPEQSGSQASTTYADTRSGIEQQFADILKVVRVNDEPSIHKVLDTLSIPDANGWIAAHFAPEFVAQEQQAYQETLKKFQSHVWWATGNFGIHPEFALQVKESELPSPLSDEGFEGLVPRPRDPVKIENFRFISTVTDPKLGKPNWVSSFVYLDGRFRIVGSTYPFWAQSMEGARGPMSLPPEVINGRSVQAEAFRHDVKGPGIDGIVHIRVEVGRDGKLKNMKVLSGDREFISDAATYLRDAEYQKLPDDPRLANARLIWDMEVVFFSPKSPSPAGP